MQNGNNKDTVALRACYTRWCACCCSARLLSPFPVMPSTQRLEWLDLFRGLAVLGMIWTHAANTFLQTRLQATAWYGELSYYHGLIAPAFFWISGFVRAHVTASSVKPAGPAVKRLLQVMLVGYLLHFPWNALPSLKLTAEQWQDCLKVDVLQCLAVTGLLLLVVERFGRWRQVVAALLLVAFVGLQTAAQKWHTGMLPLDQYLNRNAGSLFPLFPWVGFGLAGFLARGLWGGTPDWRGGLLLLGGAALVFQPLSAWLGRAPAFFAERLGWVIMAAILVACVAGAARVSAATGWLRLAGRESLLLYVAHLVMIHSIPLPKRTLQYLIGPTQPIWSVALIAAVLFLLCLALGRMNEARKLSLRSSR